MENRFNGRYNGFEMNPTAPSFLVNLQFSVRIFDARNPCKQNRLGFSKRSPAQYLTVLIVTHFLLVN